ncbi:MAG: hypothetical protein QME81_11520 [bacterium]|nr:hypothetical protein [bacterium]
MRKALISIWIATLLLGGASFASAAKKEALPFLAAATENKAYIVLLKSPGEMEGFNIYRKGSKDKEFVKLNEEPVTAVRDPLVFRDILGDDYDWVERAVKGEDEFMTLRRIKRDPGTMVVLSLASLKVAQALGRLWIDEPVEIGKEYRYRVAYLNLEGEEFEQAEQAVRLKEIKPSPSPEIKAEAGDSQVKVSWEYPAYKGKPEDMVVGFNIYRQAGSARQGEGEESFKKINRVLIMRQEEHFYQTDETAVNEITYTYYMTAVDLIGRESAPSDTVAARPVDTTPPRMPTGVKTIPEEGRIIVVWDMNLELDLDHYNIFKAYSLQDNFVQLNKEPIPGDKPEWVDEDVTVQRQAFYKIQAVDKKGNAGTMSNAMSGLPKDTQPPGPPVELSFEVKERKVYLSWQPPEDKDVMGYYIYRGETKDRFMRITPTTCKELEFADKGYEEKGHWPGKTFYYGVTSVDYALNESEKQVMEVLIPDDEPPLSPAAIYANTTKEGQIKIGWQPSMSLDAAGYKLYREKEGEELKLLEAFEGKVYSYLDAEVEKGKRYGYQVTAIDRFENESEPTDRAYAVPSDIVPPPAPGEITAIATDEGVNIQWKEVDIDDLSGYNVYRSDYHSGIYERLNQEILSKPGFLDEKGKAGHYYRVTTIDTSGHENDRVRPVKAVKEKEEGDGSK